MVSSTHHNIFICIKITLFSLTIIILWNRLTKGMSRSYKILVLERVIGSLGLKRNPEFPCWDSGEAGDFQRAKEACWMLGLKWLWNHVF
jgi:hypothetical protein